jgi:hypothetical protein
MAEAEADGEEVLADGDAAEPEFEHPVMSVPARMSATAGAANECGETFIMSYSAK